MLTTNFNFIINFIGTASVIATLIFRIIPILGIIKLINTGETKHVPFLIYICTLLSTSFFTMVGVKSEMFPIILINGSAVIIMPIYLTIYFNYINSSRYVRISYIILLYSLIISVNFIGYQFLTSDICGEIAMVLSFIDQSSQLYTIYLVVESENSIYIDIYLIYSMSLTNFLNVVYGLMMNKRYLWVSMTCGFCLNVIQIIMVSYIKSNQTVPIQIPNFLDQTSIIILHSGEMNFISTENLLTSSNSNNKDKSDDLTNFDNIKLEIDSSIKVNSDDNTTIYGTFLNINQNNTI